MNVRRLRVLVLSGGVGGAKLAQGFEQLRDRVDLTVVVNVGDDFEHLGLSISPDIDTVLYTLSGQAHRAQGWGLEGESWRTLERVRELGGEDWFRLGDLDLATHLIRTAGLRAGRSLTEVLQELAQKMQISAALFPATDMPLRTRLTTDRGVLDFQHYFVRERCEPVVRSIEYRGADRAAPPAALIERLEQTDVFDAVVLAPSNPFLSLAPILAVPGMVERLRNASPRVLAVSPIIAGQAVKGPAAKLMNELGLDVTASGWAHHLRATYPGLVDEWVLDNSDRKHLPALLASGFNARISDTLMVDDARRRALALTLLQPGDDDV